MRHPSARSAVAVVALLALASPAGCAWVSGAVVSAYQSAQRESAGFARREVQTADGPVPYLEGGRGETILLLHGFEDSKDDWVPFARELTSRYRVLIPDLAAHGANHAPTNGDYRPDAQAARMRDFLAALHVRTAHVAGVTMGGEIAGSFAAHYPAATRSMALFSAAGTRPDTPTVLAQRIRDGDNVFHVDNAAELDRLIVLIGDSGFTVPGIARRTMLQEYRRRNAQWDTVLAQLLEPAQVYRLDSLAPRTTVPALVMWGVHDPIFAVSGARRLASRLPDAELVILPDCGHLCVLTRARESAAAYLRFLNAIGASSRAPPAR